MSLVASLQLGQVQYKFKYEYKEMHDITSVVHLVSFRLNYDVENESSNIVN